MNDTIKGLVMEKIVGHMMVQYLDYVDVKPERVDVKNGKIRFWESKNIVSYSLDLADLDCTEDEAKELVKESASIALFRISNKPVTDNFKQYRERT